ncbi:hypothetical protein FCH79_20595 [Pseudomonas koreensis]|nr:hypothetical protein [Pseudomonas koreensis]
MSASPVNDEFGGIGSRPWWHHSVRCFYRRLWRGSLLPLECEALPLLSFRYTGFSGFTTTSSPSGSKLPRHKRIPNARETETKMPDAMPGILCSSSNSRWRIRMAISSPLAGSCRRSCCPFFPGCWLRSCARHR